MRGRPDESHIVFVEWLKQISQRSWTSLDARLLEATFVFFQRGFSLFPLLMRTVYKFLSYMETSYYVVTNINYRYEII